jgi:hypothetical protein
MRRVDDTALLRAPQLARGPARRDPGTRVPHPGRHARGPRASHADRHRPAHHGGDLPTGRRGGSRRGRPPAGDPPRLLAAPHGFPRPDHDRLGHVHALPRGRRQLAGPPRIQAHPLPERARVEPESRRDGRPPRGPRARHRSRSGGFPYLWPGFGQGDRRAAGIRSGRDGPRVRARDVHVSRHRPGGGRDGEGRGRAQLPPGEARDDGLVRRPAQGDAMVVVLLEDGHPGRRVKSDRREGQSAPRSGGLGVCRIVRELLARPLPERLQPQETLS